LRHSSRRCARLVSMFFRRFDPNNVSMNPLRHPFVRLAVRVADDVGRGLGGDAAAERSTSSNCSRSGNTRHS
jgi:hypothetical protein